MTSADTVPPPFDGQDSPGSSPDPVVRAVDEFDTAVAAAQQLLVDRVGREIMSPLGAAARAAVQEHTAILRSGSATSERGDADGSGQRDRERVDAYRRAVSTRVIEPIHACLATLDIGLALARMQMDSREAIVAAADAAPAELVRSEPPDMYAARAGDSIARRWRKGAVRTRRGAADVAGRVLHTARSIGRRRDITPSRRTQTVPLARILRHHAAVRLAPGADRAMDVLRTRVAAAIDELERGLTVWLHALLEPDPEHEIGAVDEAAATLTLVLETLAACDPVPDFAAALDERAAAVHDRLSTDVAQAGTFMLDADALPTDMPVRAARAAAERETLWIRWHRQSVARVELVLRLEQFQRAVPAALTGLVNEIDGSVIRPVREILLTSRDAIAAVHADVKAACDRARVDHDAEAMSRAIAAAFERVRDRLTHGTRDPLEERSLSRRTRTAAEACIAEITTMLAALPVSLEVHEPSSAEEPAFPDAKPVTVRLRRIAEQAYDAVLLERLHTAPQPVIAALDRIRMEVRQLENVVGFSLDSSLAELGTGAGAEGLAGAEELALNGIDRTLHTLGELHTAWNAELPALALRLQETNDSGWSQLHDRVRVEDRGQEQLLDFRYRIRSALREGVDVAAARTRRTLRYGSRLARIGRGRAQELIRLGQSAVEGAVITDEERRQTLEALFTVDSTVATLPLVYRRLFSFQPVTDPALLVGRTADLEAVAHHLAQWRIGVTDAFVVTSFDGNGCTSFLNVVQDTVFDGMDVRRIRFADRVLEEPDLAAILAKALGVSGPEPTANLDNLARRIGNAPPADIPVACIIENLEHLLFRTSRSNGLVGALLTFMSRLDSRVFWLATISESAWKYIDTVENGAARLVRRQPLTPITRADLEAVITKRHLRSGLGLLFETPKSPTPILRRRLGKARDDAERQTVLRTDFFDRLHRQCGQNLLLAMFYWIRSVSLDAATSTIRVQPITPLSFGYIADLPLEYAFALKAFLDHATLTPAEYDQIFHGSGGDSRHVFETLGNMLIIEPAETEQGPGFVFTTIQDGARYRIRPIVVHPVLVSLRARNIVT